MTSLATCRRFWLKSDLSVLSPLVSSSLRKCLSYMLASGTDTALVSTTSSFFSSVVSPLPCPPCSQSPSPSPLLHASPPLKSLLVLLSRALNFDHQQAHHRPHHYPDTGCCSRLPYGESGRRRHVRRSGTRRYSPCSYRNQTARLQVVKRTEITHTVKSRAASLSVSQRA